MPAARYRKRPVVVEALKYMGTNASLNELSSWMGRQLETLNVDAQGQIMVGGLMRVEIKTLEGTMVAEPGDYVIKGVAGEFYPCKPEIFLGTYELVRE